MYGFDSYTIIKAGRRRRGVVPLYVRFSTGAGDMYFYMFVGIEALTHDPEYLSNEISDYCQEVHKQLDTLRHNSMLTKE